MNEEVKQIVNSLTEELTPDVMNIKLRHIAMQAERLSDLAHKTAEDQSRFGIFTIPDPIKGNLESMVEDITKAAEEIFKKK